jgi:hypothetical protein
MMTLPRATPLALLLAVLAAPMVPAQQAYDSFGAGDFGRIRFEENGVHIVRDPGGSPFSTSEAASINTPIFNGDEIRTDHGQRVEVELAGGTLIRVDHETELVFRALPEPFADNPDNAILKLGYGTVQISSELVGKGEFRIDTPDASIYLLGNGDFRIEVDDYGQTRIFSRRGVAEIEGDGGSVLIRGGLRTTAYAGSAPDEPQSFNTFAIDGFDRWVDARNDTRDTYVASDESAYEQIPSEVRPYYRELSSHGRWVHVPEYGYTWYPYDVPAGWRPYSDGYWSHSSRGYFWVSNEPWGWAPYHYGRWNWVTGYGWCWAPGRLFGGAWVSWSWGRAHLGWAPLNYWNQPVWVRSVRYGYYDPRCWTFVAYNDFGRRGRGGRRSVDDVIDDLDNTAVVTRPPRVSPRVIAADPAPRERLDRELRRDPSGRTAVIRAGRRPSETFADAERETLQRTSRSSRRVLPPRASGSAGRERIVNSVNDLAPASRTSRRTLATTRSSGPDRTNATADTRGRGTAATTRRAPSRQRAAASPADSGRSATREADKRRNHYRKMSEPRTTRQRASSPPRSSGETRSRGSTARSSSSRRSKSSAAASSSASRSKPSGSRSPSASRSKKSGATSSSSGRQRSSGSKGSSSSRGSGRGSKNGRK